MNKDEKRRVAQALGAERVVELKTKRVSGPLDLLALRAEFTSRLRSTGGRPTDPAWTLTRQVPFKDESWSRLQGLASEVGATGRKVGPAQVAALLIESSLEEFEDDEWNEVLAESRQLALLSQPEAADAARVTYKQLDDWVQKDWVRVAGRAGHRRSFSADEVMRAFWLRSISEIAADVAAAAEAIRASDVGDRYLVVTDGRDVSTAPSRTRLYRVLASAGSHLVIDQLAERRKLIGLPPQPDDEHERQEIRRAV